jgi:hypothetical protein
MIGEKPQGIDLPTRIAPADYRLKVASGSVASSGKAMARASSGKAIHIVAFVKSFDELKDLPPD